MPRIASINSLERPSSIREVNKKYFFALEGIRTEVDYIKTAISLKKTNSHIFYFYRNKNDFGSSNMLRITEMLVDIMDGQKNMEFMYENVIDIISDTFTNKNVIVMKNLIKSRVESYAATLGKNLHDVIEKNEIEGLLSKLKNVIKIKIEDIICKEDLIQLIKKQSTYEPNIDEIIIVGDRDKESFVDPQYDKVLKMVGEKKINLILTNPCIEFWFLLHHTDALEIDKSEWNTSPKAAELVRNELKKYDPNYKKNSIDSDFYLSKTKIAIRNSDNYSSSLIELKSSIGTNMPKLFDLINNMK